MNGIEGFEGSVLKVLEFNLKICATVIWTEETPPTARPFICCYFYTRSFNPKAKISWGRACVCVGPFVHSRCECAPFCTKDLFTRLTSWASKLTGMQWSIINVLDVSSSSVAVGRLCSVWGVLCESVNWFSHWVSAPHARHGCEDVSCFHPSFTQLLIFSISVQSQNAPLQIKSNPIS